MELSPYNSKTYPGGKDHIPLLDSQLKVTFVPAKVKEEVLPVDVKNAQLVFRESKNVTGGIFDVSLTVPQGAICAILGPSGCGKTTLLKCLVGLNFVQKGQIKIFGYHTGTADIGVLESKVGYMPQDLSLYFKLDARETLRYFGGLQLIPKQVLKERINFLIDLLDIPRQRGLLVENLSGGQQRRLSLAVALVHDPPLLLLDEPTVGMDPLLRSCIWKHLHALAQRHGKTILITTHYIEEARKADMVAFMREGRILLKENPQLLLRKFQCTTLEKVFLELCKSSQQEINDYLSASPSAIPKSESSNKLELLKATEKTNQPEIHQKTDIAETGKSDITPKNEVQKRMHSDSLENERNCLVVNSRTPKSKSKSESECIIIKNCTKLTVPEVKRSFKSYLCVVWTNSLKNTILLKRNFAIVGIFLLLPIVNCLLVKNYLGSFPFDIPLAVVNEENPPDLSADFVNYLSNKTFAKRFLNDSEEAARLVRDGAAWGAVIISRNFTNSFLSKARVLEHVTMMNYVESDKSLRVIMDASSVVIWMTTYKSLLEDFEAFAKGAFRNWNIDTRFIDYPLQFEKPIYNNDKDPSFATFGLVNIMTNSLFITGLGVTGMSMVIENIQGCMERSRVSGLSLPQIFLSTFLINGTMTCVQIVILLSYVSVVAANFVNFEVLLLTAVICYLNSLIGMGCGLLITTIFKNTVAACFFAIGIFQVDLTMSGILWPAEGSLKWFRPFLVLSPEHFQIQAVRDLFLKGWGLNYQSVWLTIFVCGIWIIALLCLTTLIFERARIARKLRRVK